MVRSYSRKQAWYKEYNNYLIGAAFALALGVVGWFGYKLYARNYEQKAYSAFATQVDSFNKLTQAQTPATPEQLGQLDQQLAQAAQQYTGSALYPYFLVYRAEILDKLGKHDDAIALMNTVVNKLDTNNSLYPLYATKRALMKLDAQQEALQKEGQQELEQLAQDTRNPLQDMALYYKGLMLLQAGDKEAAEQAWAQLIASAKQDSVWAQLAQEKSTRAY